MEEKTEALLSSQITDFKKTVWNEVVGEIGSFLYPTDLRLIDSFSTYSASMELLKKNEPFFKLTFFFRVFKPNIECPNWYMMPSICLSKGDMELSGLEKQFKGLDKEITLIRGSEISDMIKSLIRSHG